MREEPAFLRQACFENTGLCGKPCRVQPDLLGPLHASGKRQFSLRDLGSGTCELYLERGRMSCRIAAGAPRSR